MILKLLAGYKVSRDWDIILLKVAILKNKFNNKKSKIILKFRN